MVIPTHIVDLFGQERHGESSGQGSNDDTYEPTVRVLREQEDAVGLIPAQAGGHIHAAIDE